MVGLNENIATSAPTELGFRLGLSLAIRTENRTCPFIVWIYMTKNQPIRKYEIKIHINRISLEMSFTSDLN